MNFASPLLYLSKGEEDEIEVDESVLEAGLSRIAEEMEDNLAIDDSPMLTRASPFPPLAPKRERNPKVMLPRSAPTSGRPPISKSDLATPIYKRKVDSNIVQLELGTLGDEASISTGDPYFCTACGAAFSNLSTINNKENTWDCDLCDFNQTVDISEGERPTIDTLDYLLEPPPLSALSSKSSVDEKLIIFCVDVSGSMCVTSEVHGNFAARNVGGAIDGITEEEMRDARRHTSRNVSYISRLQSIQIGVEKIMEKVAKENPNFKVGLITFSGSVTLIGDGSSEPRVISGDRLLDYEELVKIGDGYPLTQPIKNSITSLKTKLNALDTNGATALGPAIACAVSMAAKKNGSKIIICTDGIANVGLGSLEINRDNTAEYALASSFYQQIGSWAQSHGVVIDVLGIEGECDLENLGLMSELTGGDVSKLNPVDIISNTNNLTTASAVATSVSATLFLHKDLKFRSSNSSVEDKEVPSNKVDREIGNVSKDTEISFEYEIRDTKSKVREDGIPFQVQIRFTKLDGSKMIRIITKKQKITTSREEAIKGCDMSILSSHAAQQSAALASEGDYFEARANMIAWSKMMERDAKTEEQKMQCVSFARNNATMDDAIQGAMSTESGDLFDLTPIEVGGSARAYLSEEVKSLRKDERTKARSSNDGLSSAIRKTKKVSSKMYSPSPSSR